MLPFPYSPFAAAQHLFGYNDPKHKDVKKTEFVKFMDICEHFFITHPASGQKEGHEHERVMLFLPSSQTLTKQMEITGMAEAIVNFSSSLLFNQPSDSEVKCNKQQSKKSISITSDDESIDFRYISSSTSKEVVLVVENASFFVGVSLNRLIQYSVEKRDLIPLWHFLSQTIVPSAMQAELTPEGLVNNKSAANTSSDSSNKTGFFVDSSIIRDYLGEFSSQQFPKVFILDDENDEKCVEYYLVAYRVLNATACFFVRDDSTQNDLINSEFLENLSNFIDTQMSSIASTIGDQFSIEITARPSTNSDIPYHFIYFNPDSLSFRKSFAAPMVISAENAVLNTTVQILPSSMHRLVYESYDKFISDCSSTSSLISQLYIKADNDWWIVFKRMERRFLALFLPQQYSATTTIAYIQECVDGIIQSRFPNLFIS
uniref:Intu_longin_1 domain-containing protein n=1 Tax=Meloidogyne hapla TaxID=6305 RepID=A0A1I8B0J7_MELHA